MKVILQRSLQASVQVENEIVGQIEQGLVALVGVGQGDSEETVRALAEKTVNLRIFSDENGKMNRNVIESGGGILVISQFTLLADCRKGRRPSFTDAAPPDRAKELYELYAEHLAARNISVARGIFAADMQVSLINDGPVTIILDSAEIQA
ncbi:D-aminoacyl-tRNA deacylase [Allorhodopirellula heiligendammensis]|uniref:D-aminoacyl-tRNA deacylase n=1 Tax=Allorhodopirellula heiligendammensis TaxID=2714739 RepID=A0A5C6C6E6_9BACT|nr:D-aminoacyl-tRNA deacylase [Allorhodopirellula heiligendammensis]TWU19051.1 D-tyrosyl-tRNA(Tyr) deacylase [Allorhodopirellula heiligendammensis]